MTPDAMVCDQDGRRSEGQHPFQEAFLQSEETASLFWTESTMPSVT